MSPNPVGFSPEKIYSYVCIGQFLSLDISLYSLSFVCSPLLRVYSLRKFCIEGLDLGFFV